MTEEQVTEMANDYRDALDNGDRVVSEWREMDTAKWIGCNISTMIGLRRMKANFHRNVFNPC